MPVRTRGERERAERERLIVTTEMRAARTAAEDARGALAAVGRAYARAAPARGVR